LVSSLSEVAWKVRGLLPVIFLLHTKTCRADVGVPSLLTSGAREEVFWSLVISVVVLLARRLLVRVFSVAWVVDPSLG
jgi:hypothetical protein